MTARALALALLLALAGCDGLDFTAPAPVDLDGSWSFSVHAWDPGAAICQTSGATLEIQQDGDRFTGSLSAGTGTCDSWAGTQPVELPPGEVVDGRVEGDRFQFSIERFGEVWEHGGRMVDGVLEGSFTYPANYDFQTGRFRAERP